VIRDPEWDHVRKTLDEYPDWIDDETLRVLSGKRSFERTASEIDGYSLKEITGEHFCAYFDEMDLDKQIQQKAEAACQQEIAPHVRDARRALGALLRFAKPLPSERLISNIQQMLCALEDVGAELEAVWSAEIARMSRGLSDIMPDILGPQGAKMRLILRLWTYLTDLTNLTRANRTEHINGLLDHFGRQSADKFDLKSTDDSVNRLVGSGRSKRHIDALRNKWLARGGFLLVARESGDNAT
jgi:hypothetical protein